MADEVESLQKRLRELETELEETRSLSQARSKLLEANVKELNEVYTVLNEKIKEIRRKEARIRSFDDELIKANKLSALGEMASSIAHEIKNPLIAIQGFAKRIEKTTDPVSIGDHAKLIDTEAARLSAVLAKLLDFSRMNGPKTESVNANEVIDDTILFMEHHLTRFKQVTLKLDKGTNLPAVVIDRIHIQQALVNIIMNAAQAMPQGGLITIRTASGDGKVSISVSDQGTGIREEDLDKIFEPFYSTKVKGEGTGLGLSLTRRLVEANNGRIEVKSSPGTGSTFTLFLPADTAVKADT
jgi:signal transduction histidine kinase